MPSSPSSKNGLGLESGLLSPAELGTPSLLTSDSGFSGTSSQIPLPKEVSLLLASPKVPFSPQGPSFSKAERKEVESLSLYSQQEKHLH